jgi:cation:H+ antiporter
VTPAGLTVDPSFFRLAFPAMLFVLIVFRIGIYVCRTELTKRFGLVLLAAYFAYLGLSVATGVNPGH